MPAVQTYRDPILTIGSEDELVPELADQLAQLGHDPGPIGSTLVDEGLIAAVRAFRAEHGVADDPEQLPPGADPNTTVGQATWHALRVALGIEPAPPAPDAEPTTPDPGTPGL